MKLLRSLTVGGVAGLLAFGALWLWLPARGAPAVQEVTPQSGGIAGMHAACLSGDATAMRSSMEALTEDDRDAMAHHMADGFHGEMMRMMGTMGGTMEGHPRMMGQGDSMNGMMSGAGGMTGMMP